MPDTFLFETNLKKYMHSIVKTDSPLRPATTFQQTDIIHRRRWLELTSTVPFAVAEDVIQPSRTASPAPARRSGEKDRCSPVQLRQR